MTATRRQVLASAGALAGFALAGCTSPGQVGGPSADETVLRVRVNNQSGRTQPVAVTVTGADGTAVVELSDETIPAGVSETFERTGLDGDSYSISVEGTDWATGAVWTPASCPTYTVVTRLEGTEGKPDVAIESSCSGS
ncbi:MULTISPECIES: hypothetical protein [Salinibaculum]|uniref:hypothetical protein n=1 Tax=Salinibaculum TaxID=2732368 RepID=UPI0030CB3CEF